MREQANREALQRIFRSNPVWIDVMPAKEVIPGMTDRMILHSGPPIAWEDMIGGQRKAVLGACLYERLAVTETEAEEKIARGEIRVEPCQDHQTIGSLTGIYYPSMPVFVVENKSSGNRGYCSIYEGPYRRRLTYGVYDEGVHKQLDFVRDVLAPVLKEAVKRSGGIELKPIMARALRMGDELHSRNTAATMILMSELATVFTQMAAEDMDRVLQAIDFIKKSDLFFLHLGMAASKVTADSAYHIEGSSIVTAMALNCREIGIRVSGLGNRWFTAPIPPAEAKLFEGVTEDDLEYMGGESLITETMGLGGFAQVSAFPLQAYNGGIPARMIENNARMYEITLGEHPEFRLPYFEFRGTPVGIDIFLVCGKRIEPMINMGMSHKDGGQAGAGMLKIPLAAFDKAIQAYKERYPSDSGCAV